ncbi:asparagine synthase (glutamine-hydrolyzing) [Candidatus Poribacteria bacterium]|nr:asparagine synthase (glutamine-hydrolyzing) [Candidatus Poribacteria bacterium]
MCGIVGIYNLSKFVDTDLLIRMRDTMIHRGPDDAGLYISNDKKLGLGQRRLSILDLSTAGRQPMNDELGKIWIVYNGEVYNFKELKKELIDKGYKFRTQTDTEVIIYLYKEYGISFVHKLRGMFALGIWDSDKKNLILIRDRMGIKPLYYTYFNGQFIFASEIKAILEHPGVKREVDEDAFYHYLSFLTAPTPDTLFKNIKKLAAGYILTVNENIEIKVEEYWDVFDNVQPLYDKPDSFYTEMLLDTLRESVRYRMVSDVPVGVFLSGGLDSSTNTALFSEFSEEQVKTFSIGFRGQDSYNEFKYARKVAEMFGTDHHELWIGVDDLVDFLPQLVYHQDEPIADPVCVPMYYVSKLARDNGVIVCQVGEGSDELFCGYPGWRETLKLNSLTPYLRVIPSFIRKFGLKSLEIAGKSDTGKYEKFCRVHNGESIFWGGAEAFGENEKQQVLSLRLREKYKNKSSYEVVAMLYEKFLERSPIKDYLHFMSYIDLRFRLPELLLTRTDKMSMATSLETRVPFLDHEFVELSMSIPENVKMKNGELKYILKKSLENKLPDDIIYRKKQGFSVPVMEWFFDKLGDYAKQKLNNFTRRTDYFNPEYIEMMLARQRGAKLWYVLNFALWYERWIEGIK